MKEYKDGAWTPSEPVNGDRVRVYKGLSVSEFTWYEETAKNKYNTVNEVVKINGYPNDSMHDVYSEAKKGDSLTLTADIVDENGDILTAINSGSAWRMPIEKILSNGNVIDETKLDTTIVNGQCTAILSSFPSGGTWYISEKRVNQSLDEIGAPWHIKLTNMKFWVAE